MTFVVVLMPVDLVHATVSEQVVLQAIMAPTISHPTSQLVAVVLEEQAFVFYSASSFKEGPLDTRSVGDLKVYWTNTSLPLIMPSAS